MGASARVRWLLASLLLVPLALAAEVIFEVDIEDAAGEVPFPSGDITRLSVHVLNNTTVQERVEMRARPIAPDDSILVRNWYHDSENGSFHVVDMEVRGDEPNADARFKPVKREGDFRNETFLAGAHYGLDNSTWVFEFPLALMEGATCFDPGAFAEHTPPRRTGLDAASDSAYLTTERRCRTAIEPAPHVPRAPIVGVAPGGTPAASPPGSQAPTPIGPSVPLAAIAIAVALAYGGRHKA